jgi:uncharacterized membrane protein YdjX (TVP38/TMEM64 family)
MGPMQDRLAGGAAQRWAFALMVLLMGGTLVVADSSDLDTWLSFGEELAGRAWALPALILLQAALFTFGLPGALVLWLVAPFFDTATAIATLLVGSLLGCAGARAVGAWLGEAVRAQYAHRRAFALLAERGDWGTQTALRLLPGFPHTVVNFGAGVLGLPLGPFLLAALVGFGVKCLLYVPAVRGLLADGEPGFSLGAATLLPLVLLALFVVLGNWAGRRWALRMQSG